MSKVKTKKIQKVDEYESTKHAESCGCESVTGVTEEDTRERE